MFKMNVLTTAMMLLTLLAQAHVWILRAGIDSLPTIAKTNSSIIILKGERTSTIALLAEVKQQKEVFIKNQLIPHNNNATEQKSQLATLLQVGFDPNSQTSVDEYNRKIGILNNWGQEIDANKKKLDPIWFDINTREIEYTKKIEELETRIKELIKKYRSNCLDETEDLESSINCWGIYFDGEGKREPLPVIVPQSIKVYPNGAPTAFTDLSKEYKERLKLDNKPGPPAPKPEPPQKGILEKATDKVREYYKDFINNHDTYKTRRTTAITSVRG